MTLAKKVGALGLHPDDEIEMIGNGMLTSGVTDPHQERSAQQMASGTQGEIVAAAVIATHVGRGADPLENVVQGVDLRGEIEMTEDDLVVGRCLAAMIIMTLSEGRDLHEGAVHSDLNGAKGRALPGGDARSLALARGVIQNLESVLNLARGQERGSRRALRADGRGAPRGGPSQPGPDLGKAV